MKIFWAFFAFGCALIFAPAWTPFFVRAQPQPPGQALACGGGITVLLDGKPLSTGCVVNIKSGNGVIAIAVPNQEIGGTDISFSFNSALMTTHDAAHANENYCASLNGTSFYTCKLPNKALLTYQAGQVFLLNPDVPCSGNCSVSVDDLGPKNLFGKDGVTTANFPAEAQWIWYDGKIMRLL
jgi:hypothetical protein